MAFQKIEFMGDTFEFPESMPDSEIQDVLTNVALENDKPTLNEVSNAEPQAVDLTEEEVVAEDLEKIITSAATTVGVPPQYMLAIAAAESNLKPRAKNPRSTASGLFQFIESTWNDQVATNGNKHGVMVGDVFDSRSNALMGAEFTKVNFDALTKFLGRPPTLEETYFAHFSGLGGAKKILKKMKTNPKLSAVDAWGQKAADANPTIFTAGATAQDVLKKLTRRVTRASERFPDAAPKQEAVVTGLSDDEIQRELAFIATLEDSQVIERQDALRKRLGIGEFARNASGDMSRVEGGLFEDPDGNLVVIDDQGNRRDLDCG